MSIKVRGTIAVLAGCLAAAAGATPAVASANVPIEIPLAGVENALHMDVPELSTEAPVPIPGAPEGPRYSQDHVLPQNALPRLPVSSELPATQAGVPVPRLLPGEPAEQIGLSAEGSPVHTLTPGASVNPPLSGPRSERFGLPQVSAPQAAVGTPDVQARPGADLALG
ncbi:MULTISPECIES: hypothetical protein [unclassified Streptomyces]|uniref:hypothetical protein n=1 Tax=unclassified Streptomyces TaxID=2593676 RepID=UPI000DB9E617|nr:MULTISPECIES: hypothetical protein [unclassified Streptomyces]MYT73039.1 hypothetical protein [Streptomyces sp. SID8367]RAJ73836.1 hypothetical protein K377_06927 [Streptomyces sp. PsTaAH-137]